MGKAARAIIFEDDKILVMYRNKEGSEYYTLVGGRVQDGESIQQGLVREVKEETGLEITAARPVFVEPHPEPYNEQYIFLCEVAPHPDVAIQDGTEEGFLNKLTVNIHQPVWMEIASFPRLPFRTPQLQQAITEAVKSGFPAEPIAL